jgi:type IV pilus assembly protein PilQ
MIAWRGRDVYVERSMKTLKCLLIVWPLLVAWAAAPLGAQQADTGEMRTMSLDVKDVDIRDAIRMISKGYDINVLLDPEVSGTITVHLTDVPIMEGLQSIAATNGLEVTKEGSLYRIRRETREKRSLIRYQGGYLTVDVQNVEVGDFIKDISSKTAVSIVPDSKISGKVTGKLYQVPLDDGLRALLEGNGFKVTRRRDIYRVSSDDEVASGAGPSRRRPRNRGRSDFFVEYEDGFVTVDIADGRLEDVIKAIAEQSDIEIVVYGVITGEVNAKLNDMPLTEALTFLLGGTKFTFVQNGNVILIGDRNAATPAGQALSKSELIHLKHIKADEVPKVLPKNIPSTNVKVVKEQNALLVAGTSEDIVKTREFLNTIDIPTPQVIIDAIVVEYSRDLNKDFGIEYGYDESGKTGNDNYSFPHIQYNRTGPNVKHLLNMIPGTSDDFTRFVTSLPDNFYFQLRLLEDEGKARVLAKPSITVLNGNKASINVGQTQYYRIVAGTSENPTFRFQPISFGIKLDITPWISLSGQITAEISPEISNPMGINEEGYPNVFRRSVTTTVRLENGQTLVLGGLLRSDEQIRHKKVPILGDIPILGYLFKTTKKINTETNLVIYITPRVIEKENYVDINRELDRFDMNSSGMGNGFFRKLKNRRELDRNQDKRRDFGEPSRQDPQAPGEQRRGSPTVIQSGSSRETPKPDSGAGEPGDNERRRGEEAAIQRDEPPEIRQPAHDAGEAGDDSHADASPAVTAEETRAAAEGGEEYPADFDTFEQQQQGEGD